MTNGSYDVLGIGNAIVDVIASADEAFLVENGLTKGAMTLVEAEQADELYALMPPAVEISGGSAANTAAGIASLGGRAAYIGKVHDDQFGTVFAHDLRAAGVTYRVPPAPTGPATARCLVLVTPDAERTMQTYLGVSVELGPEDVDADLVSSANITYLEGYLFDRDPAKEAFYRACALAHRAGRRVALSLSDTFCVERHRSDFRRLLTEEVDLLFANEGEILALYEARDLEQALRAAVEDCALVVATLGERGSIAATARERIEVEAEPVESVVDTTGAGDLYAAGFLYGITSGYDLAEAARLGGMAAAEIIGHLGARPEMPLSELVTQRFGAPGAERA